MHLTISSSLWLGNMRYFAIMMYTLVLELWTKKIKVKPFPSSVNILSIFSFVSLLRVKEFEKSDCAIKSFH